MKAVWNNQVIAESNDTIVVEGNYYFPEQSITKEYISESSPNTVCPWKGTASYFSVNVDGKENVDAAWYYPEPSKLAKNLKNYVAFWNGVEVSN